MRRRAFAVVVGVVGAVGAIATSCSAFTSFDGLSGQAGADAGSPGDARPSDEDAGDARDASLLPDDAASGPRRWRRIDVTGAKPSARSSARMAFDAARGKVVLYGGAQNGTTFDDTWEWDGASWSLAPVVAKPSPRKASGLTYDSARRVTVLVGGSSATPEPWEWNGGSTWRSSGASASSPDVGYAAAIAYDRARDLLVIFGGLRGGQNGANDETWEWSATNGYVKREVPSPPARLAHMMVYDVARARAIVFGGRAFSGEPLGDLWEYDGASWTERKPALSPPPRKGLCGAYDGRRRVTVIFGGRGDRNDAALADTWEWDGTTWRPGADGPSPRASCAMAFDEARNQLVMFGGSPRNAGSPTVTDETWVYE